MKRLFLAVGALVVLVLIAAVVVPFLVPAEVYKEKIVQATREATGRELSLNGEIKFSILPRLELQAEDVAFANAPGAATPQMAALEELILRLQVWPLLSGQVKVDSFVLVRPIINLEIDKNGRPNWAFETAGGAPSAPATGTQTTGEQSTGTQSAGAPTLPEISLGDVRLEDGLVTFRDARGGEAVEISDIQMKLSLPDLDSPARAEGSLVWNEEKLDLSFETATLRGLLGGQTTPIGLSLNSKPVNLGYDGKVTNGAPPKIEGEIDLDVPSIRELAAWTGNPLDVPGEGLGPLKIKGTIAATDKVFAFNRATIALDAINATGDLTADIRGQRPSLKGSLDVDAIDLNTYLPPEEDDDGGAAASGGTGAQTGTSTGGPAPATTAGPQEWSDEPLALDGLKAANVDFALSVGAIKVREIDVGPSAVVVLLKDGLLNLDLEKLVLYGGSGHGKVSLDARGAVPSVTESFVMEGIQAEPLLRDAAGFDRLSGTGRMEFALTAKGRSQKEMVSALDGKGAIKFANGAIKGINLAAMARNVQSAFLNTGAEKEQQTDFAELSGTFTITKGLLRNDDLIMLNPLVRLSGSGTSDLPKRTVNYRLEPKVVASLEGQGGDASAKGLTVPVIVEGPWHNLSYRPDLAGMAKDLMKDPGKALEGAKDTLKQLKDEGGGLEGVLKGIVKPSADGSQEGGGALPDAKKVLKGLFGD